MRKQKYNVKKLKIYSIQCTVRDNWSILYTGKFVIWGASLQNLDKILKWFVQI